MQHAFYKGLDHRQSRTACSLPHRALVAIIASHSRAVATLVSWPWSFGLSRARRSKPTGASLANATREPPKTLHTVQMHKIRTGRVGGALRLSETCARTCSALLWKNPRLTRAAKKRRTQNWRLDERSSRALRIAALRDGCSCLMQISVFSAHSVYAPF